MFFQTEREIKTRLSKDYFGKVPFRQDADTPDTTTVQAASTGVASSMRGAYSQQQFSRRIEHNIPHSPQRLRKVREDWLEIASPENLGAPQAMTTIVCNQRTSNIRSHVLCGALAVPNAEDTIDFLFKHTGPLPLQKNVGIQAY